VAPEGPPDIAYFERENSEIVVRTDFSETQKQASDIKELK